jgi:hypothetical protein
MFSACVFYIGKKTTVASRSFPENQYGSGIRAPNNALMDNNALLVNNALKDHGATGRGGKGGDSVYRDRGWGGQVIGLNGKRAKRREAAEKRREALRAKVRGADGKFLAGHNAQLAQQGAAQPPDLAAKSPTRSGTGLAAATQSRLSPKRSRVGGEDAKSVAGGVTSQVAGVSSQLPQLPLSASEVALNGGEVAGRTTPPLPRSRNGNGTPPLPSNHAAEAEDGARGGSVWRKSSGELCNEVTSTYVYILRPNQSTHYVSTGKKGGNQHIFFTSRKKGRNPPMRMYVCVCVCVCVCVVYVCAYERRTLK